MREPAEPSTARALVLDSPRQFSERQLTLPEIESDDGLLRVEACGLCGTDHEQYTGMLHPGYSFVPGHEPVGVIEAVGEVAAERWGVSVGDRVAVEVFQSCRVCDACLAGTYQRCERHGLADMLGYVPVDRAPGLWGGYAEHLYLPPDSMILPVPKTLDPVLATVYNPLGAGIRWAVHLPDTKPGDVVAVLGPGIRGLCATAAAKAAGAAFVMITGYGPRDAGRLALASRFGADLAVDVAVDNPARALRRALDGRGADVVVDVTAKAPAALGQAVKLARPGGTIVLAGTRGSAETPGFAPDDIVYKELRILGALGVDVVAYTEALAMLDARTFPFADLPREVVSFDGLPDLLATMAGEGDPTVLPPVHGVFTPVPLTQGSGAVRGARG